MPFRPTPRGIQVRLQMTQNGVRMENVFNVDNRIPVVTANLATVNGIFDAWITSDYANLVHNSVKFDQLIATDISVANGSQDVLVPTTTQGGVSGVAAPGNAAYVASLRTALTGKNYRGRIYCPGLTTAQIQDAQHATVGHAFNVNSAFNNLITALDGAARDLAVLSRWLNLALRATGVLTAIISIITDTKLDSQQRRTAN